ncbi:MAG: hypothetical protein U0165_01690 [Polyangiaceae bacterium]
MLMAVAIPIAFAARGQRALAECPISLKARHATAAWAEAIAREDERLKSDPRLQQDCRSIQLEGHPDGSADLTFVTVDGRVAKRSLATPTELGASIEALLITMGTVAPVAASVAEVGSTSPALSASSFLDPAAGSTLGASTRSTRSTRSSSEPQLDADASDSQRESRRSEIMASASVGSRAGIGHHLLSTVTLFRLSSSRGPWDLGLALEWDPSATRWPYKAPDGFAMTSVVVGGELARRFPIRRTAVSLGATAAMAWVHETATTPVGATTPSDIEHTQPRLGLLGAFEYPRDSKFRFRFDLRSDVALSGMGRGKSTENHLVAFPRVGALMAIGFEGALL